METTMIKINLEKEKSTLVSPLAGIGKSFVESFRKEAREKFEACLEANKNKLILTGPLMGDLDDDAKVAVQTAFKNYVLAVCQNLVSKTVIDETVDNWIGCIDSIISYCRKFVKDELDARELQTKYVVTFFQSLAPAVSEYFYDTEATMQSILDKKIEDVSKPKIDVPNTINAFINDNPDKAKDLMQLICVEGKKFAENLPKMTKEELKNLFITKGTEINKMKEFIVSIGLPSIDKLLTGIFDDKSRQDIIKLTKYLIEDEYDNFIEFGNGVIARLDNAIDDLPKNNVVEMPVQTSPEAAAAAAANVAQINNPMFEQEMLMKEQSSINNRVSFVQGMRETKTLINNTTSNTINELEKLDVESIITNDNIEPEVISSANIQEEIEENAQAENTSIDESKVDEIDVSETEKVSISLDERTKDVIANIEEIKDGIEDLKNTQLIKDISDNKNAAEKIQTKHPKNNTKPDTKKTVTK